MQLQLFKFDWSKRFKAFLDMFVILQIFDRFVNIVKNLILMMHKMCENV